MKIGMLVLRRRREELLLREAFKARADEVDFEEIDVRKMIFDFEASRYSKFDIIIERCISHSQAVKILELLNVSGIRTINPYEAARICGEKSSTNAQLMAAGVPCPPGRVVFCEAMAHKAIAEMGYPVVLKPDVGSWGRLIARSMDRATTQTIIEHKIALAKAGGKSNFPALYLQQHVHKPYNRDIRAFVIGDECICAIYRTLPPESADWLTNTALGAVATNCELNDDLCQIAVAAAKACQGEVMAIDLFEIPGGYSVNEVNYTMEFRNSIDTTGVDIPARIVDHAIQVAQSRNS